MTTQNGIFNQIRQLVYPNLRSLYWSIYKVGFAFLFIILLTPSFLLGQSWEIVHIRGEVSSNQEILDKGERFSREDTLSFSRTSDAMVVLQTGENSVLKLVQPKEFTVDENQGVVCMDTMCAATWTDPMINSRHNSVTAELRADGTRITKIIHVLKIENVGYVSYVEEKITSPPKTSYKAFKHKATKANIQKHVTTLNHPAINNKPNSVLIVTADWGTKGPYNPHTLGVWYNQNKWTIFNQDYANMPIDAKFNILVLEKNKLNTFVHQVNPKNIDKRSLNKRKKAYRTFLNHFAINNNPNARIFITQNWGTKGPYNPHPIGVRYHPKNKRWMIQNLDAAALPQGAKFNIYIDKTTHSFIYKTKQSTQNYSAINHQQTNNQSTSFIFTTNTSTDGEQTNSQETGIWFDNKKWHIYNQNKKSFPNNSRYNMLVVKR